jgi:hypothetical protein
MVEASTVLLHLRATGCGVPTTSLLQPSFVYGPGKTSSRTFTFFPSKKCLDI